jgi:hypothetical protein
MPTESGKPLIVISYAHADEPEHPAEGEVQWLSFVTGYLKPAIKHGVVDLWLDRLMPDGADWGPEIEQKFRACDIFILLVSRHSLSSNYVVDKEIPIIRERQAKGDAVHFYPLVLTPTPKLLLDLVRDKNLRPRDGAPLSDYSINERYRHMSEAADEIADIAAQIEARRKSEAAASEEISGAIANINDGESLGRWLREQPRETAVMIAARAALRVLPLIRQHPRELGERQPDELRAVTFRAVGLAWAAGGFPARTNELRVAARAATAAHYSATADSAFAFAASRHAAAAVQATDAAAAAAATAQTAAAIAPRGIVAALWAEIRTDADQASRDGAAALAGPLWSSGPPRWAATPWSKLRADLPKGQDWEVWIDWYEQRLRGGSRGEHYELVFASVPQDEWDKGPAAANMWIKTHLPATGNEEREGSRPEINDNASFARWLEGQNREVSIAIAARTELRISPLVVHAAEGQPALNVEHMVSQLASTVFRVGALARAAAKYPERTSDFVKAVGPAMAIAVAVAQTAGHSAVALGAIKAAIASATAISGEAKPSALSAVNAALDATVGLSAMQVVWAEIRADAVAVRTLGSGALVDLPLWSGAHPNGQKKLGEVCKLSSPRMRAGTSGSSGTSSACAANPEVRTMNSSSPAFRRKNGAKDQGRRTPGSGRIYRAPRATTLKRPSSQKASSSRRRSTRFDFRTGGSPSHQRTRGPMIEKRRETFSMSQDAKRRSCANGLSEFRPTRACNARWRFLTSASPRRSNPSASA